MINLLTKYCSDGYGLSFIGQATYILCLCCFVISISVKKNPKFFLRIGFFLLLGCYLILTTAFLTNNFLIKAVFEHSFSKTPLIYKIVAVWASPEGSLLLWNTFLGISIFFIKSNEGQRFFALHMTGMLLLQLYLLPPFETLESFSDGLDLNPLLQDYSMVVHPPILYLSQIILGLIFFKLWENDNIFPYIKLGFFLNTLGIALGSFWAYYELGWGGFWYWDPVEVISLFSWMFYALAFHMQNPRKILIYAWPITLLGMGIIRSGIINSVHSFAEQKSFLLYFLIMFLMTILIPMLFLKKDILSSLKKRMSQAYTMSPLKRNKSITLNQKTIEPSFLLWIGIFFILILSIVIPIIDSQYYFGPDFYHQSIWPLSIPLFFMMIKHCYHLHDQKISMPLTGVSYHHHLGNNQCAPLTGAYDHHQLGNNKCASLTGAYDHQRFEINPHNPLTGAYDHQFKNDQYDPLTGSSFEPQSALVLPSAATKQTTTHPISIVNDLLTNKGFQHFSTLNKTCIIHLISKLIIKSQVPEGFDLKNLNLSFRKFLKKINASYPVDAKASHLTPPRLTRPSVLLDYKKNVKNLLTKKSFLAFLFFILSSLIFYDDFCFPVLASITLSICLIGIFFHLIKFNKASSLAHIGVYIFVMSAIISGYKSLDIPFSFEEGKNVVAKNEHTIKLESIESYENDQFIHQTFKIIFDERSYSPSLQHFKSSKKTHSNMSFITEGISQSAIVVESINNNQIRCLYFYRCSILGIWIGILLILIGILFHKKR